MPAKAKEIERVARKLDFEKTRQKGNHARWKHSNGRATPILMHGNAETGTREFELKLKRPPSLHLLTRSHPEQWDFGAATN